MFRSDKRQRTIVRCPERPEVMEKRRQLGGAIERFSETLYEQLRLRGISPTESQIAELELKLLHLGIDHFTKGQTTDHA